MVPAGVEPELFVDNKFCFKGKHSPARGCSKRHMPFRTEDSRIEDDNTLLVLARQKRDEEIYGKPNMSLYFEPTKASDNDIYVEFGRIKCIADNYWIVRLIGYIVCATIFITMTLTILWNPGHPISKNAKIPESQNEWCNICRCPRLLINETIHCKICDVCVEEYDHHCPWMGKCIGRGNIAWFYIFTGSFSVIMAGIFLFSFFVILPQALKKDHQA